MRRQCIAAAILLLVPSAVLATDCAVGSTSSFPTASNVVVAYDTYVSAYLYELQAGMDIWDAGCNCGGGISYPSFSFDGTGSSLQVVYVDGHAPGKNCTNNTQYCAAEWSAGDKTLWVYEQFGDEANWTHFSMLSSDIMKKVFAHELGHALGLEHDACANGLMNAEIDAAKDLPSDECTEADALNLTRTERERQRCTPFPGCLESPIVINLDSGNFELVGFDDGIAFDMDGNGVREHIGWTPAGKREAFLFLDEDNDGLVTDGTELFGAGSFENAFAKLAHWDKSGNGDVRIGGNEDGVIDSADVIWPRLRLWIDANHDGACEPGEVFTLDEQGVTAISLQYKYSGRHDEYGNEFRYAANVSVKAPGGVRAARAYDIFFAVRP